MQLVTCHVIKNNTQRRPATSPVTHITSGAEFHSRPVAIGDWEMLRATETQVKVALLASGFCDQKK